MATKRAVTDKSIDIQRQVISKITVRVRGISPLIHHEFSQKSIKQMQDKQAGKAKRGKPPKEPEREYADSLVVYKQGKTPKTTTYGVKAIWFKLGMVDVAKEDKLGSKVKRNIRVGHTFAPDELLPIKCGKGDPHMRTDHVRLQSGVADIRYRGAFEKWEVDIPIEFNSQRVSTEQVLAWLEEAGRASGCGEWRPQKGGQCGMYEIVK